jgi:hypothetical protein
VLGTWNLVQRQVIDELTDSEVIGITWFWNCPSSDVLESTKFWNLDLRQSSGERVSDTYYVGSPEVNRSSFRNGMFIITLGYGTSPTTQQFRVLYAVARTL